jgi:hypothetical protein
MLESMGRESRARWKVPMIAQSLVDPVVSDAF